MPNGRTSLFTVTKADFAKLLEGLPKESTVGTDLNRSLSVVDVRKRIDEHVETEIVVDEQDHEFYLVKFVRLGRFRRLRALLGVSAYDNRWMAVDDSSTLHGRLRQYLEQWLKSRPAGEVAYVHDRLIQFDGTEWHEKRL